MNTAPIDVESPDIRSGRGFLRAFEYSLRWLEVNARAIDRLNVFPVPDGDTGANMVLTLRAALKEASDAEALDGAAAGAGAVSARLARGALLGARGNSGVILSQIVRGLAEGLEGRREFDAADFAAALDRAAQVAYASVTEPVEGTILTVARDAGAAAQAARGGSLDDLLTAVVDAARASVANTPNLLAVLAEAGVVDAGGQGLLVIYEGLRRYVHGEPLPDTSDTDRAADAFAAFAEAHQTDEHGFCTEFVIHGAGLDAAAMREDFGSLGGSLLVVGDDTLVRVHIHTERPGDTLNAAMAYGQLDRLKADNMDVQQARNFDQALAEGAAAAEALPANGIVAVASGEGFEDVFRSLGADVVRGGQTMNPSAGELLEAIERTPDDWALVLPNNANIHLAARQAAEQADKRVVVVPTRTMPQGVAAALAFNPAGQPSDNAQAMGRALAEVTTLEVTQAVRDATVDGQTVARGQTMGLLDGELAALDDEANAVVLRVLAQLRQDDPEIVTIYHGNSAPRAQVAALVAAIEAQHADLEVEAVDGGQDHYDYIVSIE